MSFVSSPAAAMTRMSFDRYRQSGDILPRVIGTTFPQLVVVATQLLSSPSLASSQDIPTILHTILKTYRNSIVTHLSLHQQSPESLVPWGRLLFQIVNMQIPNEAVPEDEDKREICEWWKAKKWAYAVLGRLFHRYGCRFALACSDLKPTW